MKVFIQQKRKKMYKHELCNYYLELPNITYAIFDFDNSFKSPSTRSRFLEIKNCIKVNLHVINI